MVLRPLGPVAVRIALERAKAIGFERQKARSISRLRTASLAERLERNKRLLELLL
jgi:hypothetical protein